MAETEHGADVAGAIEAVEHAHSPVDQFALNDLLHIQIGALNLSFTNSALFMAVAAGLTYLLVMAGSRQHSLVPGRLQSAVEMLYEFIAGMVQENVGREGRKYFPFFFCLFMFILLGNLVGLIPGAFTFTSHIIVTFGMAIFVIVTVTIIGFMRHGSHFLSFFVPEGVPKAMVPIMVPIEILSYCIRPFSLSIRLFVNMTAGHIMLHVFAGFVVALGGIFFLLGLGPLLLVIAVYALEIIVAIVQAYVFTILSVMYLRDAVHLH